MKNTLQNRILYYFKQRPDTFIASGSIQRMVVMKTSYTPQTAGRILRQLREDGRLEVEYMKNHAFYKYSRSDYEKMRVVKGKFIRG